MKDQMKFLLKDLAAALLGVMLTFAFAPYEIFPLAILSIVFLLALWLNVSPKRAFWLGFLFGIGLFGAGVSWVFISIHQIGGVPIPLAILITSGLVAFLALYPAFTGYFTNRIFVHTKSTNLHTAKIVLAFPAIWVFSEWIRGWFFTGFPWLFLGYSQTNSPLRGFAAILGVYGVSLAVVMTAALIFNAILGYQQKKYRSTYINIFIVCSIWIVGGLISLVPWTKPTDKAIPIALVQGNISQTIKWSEDHLQLSLDTYEKLTAPLWGKVKIIIWPEAAVPISLQDAASFIDRLDEKAVANNSTLILGIPIRTADEKAYYNSIITLGNYKQVYSKRQLVPFGEYTPLSDVFAHALKFMDVPMSNMVAGNFFQSPLALGPIRILPSICYEIAYPDLMRTLDRNISFLLTITNDAWFGKSNAQAQHLQMAKMRAIEMGRSVVFVSNDGITAIIGPDGKIESMAPPHTTYVLIGKVAPMEGLTPWMRYGSDPTLVLLIFLLLYALQTMKEEKRLLEKNDALMTTKTLS
jgi:apolipoprotein N-acyltransferase